MRTRLKTIDLYGSILEFLNENGSKRFDYRQLCNEFSDQNETSLLSELKKLNRDGLLDLEETIRKKQKTELSAVSERAELITISHKGKVYLNELENTRNNKKLSIGSLIVSIAAPLVSVWAIMAQNSNSKEIESLKETEGIDSTLFKRTIPEPMIREEDTL